MVELPPLGVPFEELKVCGVGSPRSVVPVKPQGQAGCIPKLGGQVTDLSVIGVVSTQHAQHFTVVCLDGYEGE